VESGTRFAAGRKCPAFPCGKKKKKRGRAGHHELSAYRFGSSGGKRVIRSRSVGKGEGGGERSGAGRVLRLAGSPFLRARPRKLKLSSFSKKGGGALGKEEKKMSAESSDSSGNRCVTGGVKGGGVV